MTVQEMASKFREIPPDLYQEPILAQFAETFGDLLKIARLPSNCSTQYDASNHFYMKLIAPMDIHRMGLSTREDLLQELQGLLDRYHANPSGFAASLLPTNTAAREAKRPGCG